MEHPGEGVGPEACAKTAQTSTCIHTKRRVALYRFGHSSVPCRQRPIPHPAGPSIADFEETQPSHMQAQWSPRKPIGRAPNVILAKSRAHQEAARRSIKNSTISDSIVRGRALCDRLSDRWAFPPRRTIHHHGTVPCLSNAGTCGGWSIRVGGDWRGRFRGTGPRDRRRIRERFHPEPAGRPEFEPAMRMRRRSIPPILQWEHPEAAP